MELHILTFIEQCSGLQGRRRCLAAGVLDIWHGTDPPDLGTARHGTSLKTGQSPMAQDHFQTPPVHKNGHGMTKNPQKVKNILELAKYVTK